MIELGIREFRKRFSELVNGDEFVIVKRNGKEVGRYLPTGWKPDMAKARQAAREVAAAQQALRDRGVDLDAELAGMGLTAWGEPIEDG